MSIPVSPTPQPPPQYTTTTVAIPNSYYGWTDQSTQQQQQQPSGMPPAYSLYPPPYSVTHSVAYATQPPPRYPSTQTQPTASAVTFTTVRTTDGIHSNSYAQWLVCRVAIGIFVIVIFVAVPLAFARLDLVD